MTPSPSPFSVPCFEHSAVYTGQVIHKRFAPKKHSFNSTMFMLALDVDEIEKNSKGVGYSGSLGIRRYDLLKKII